MLDKAGDQAPLILIVVGCHLAPSSIPTFAPRSHSRLCSLFRSQITGQVAVFMVSEADAIRTAAKPDADVA